MTTCRLILFGRSSGPRVLDLPPVDEATARLVCTDPRTSGRAWFVGWSADPAWAQHRRHPDNGTVTAILRELEARAA